jgi:hypothetical protein
MKKLSLVLSIVLFLCLAASAQTVRRVNNTIAATIAAEKLYKTLQEAHDASVANDILLVEPSPDVYAEATFTKALKVYGNGYFLDTNTELKADRRLSQVSQIHLNTGSSSTSLYGLYMNYVNIFGVSNITISRNFVSTIYIHNNNKSSTTTSNVSGITVTQNYMNGGMHVYGDATKTTTNLLVSNNIISSTTNLSASNVNQVVVKNNTFLGTNWLYVKNGVIENNLFPNGLYLSLDNAVASYNITSNSAFDGGVGNQELFDFDGHMVGAGSGISLDEQVQLKSNSSLKTAGSQSSEAGAFGGTTPYVISGIAPIPSVVSMVNSATGTTSSPLQVTVTVKSNN